MLKMNIEMLDIELSMLERENEQVFQFEIQTIQFYYTKVA